MQEFGVAGTVVPSPSLLLPPRLLFGERREAARAILAVSLEALIVVPFAARHAAVEEFTAAAAFRLPPSLHSPGSTQLLIARIPPPPFSSLAHPGRFLCVVRHRREGGSGVATCLLVLRCTKGMGSLECGGDNSLLGKVVVVCYRSASILCFVSFALSSVRLR